MAHFKKKIKDLFIYLFSRKADLTEGWGKKKKENLSSAALLPKRLQRHWLDQAKPRSQGLNSDLPDERQGPNHTVLLLLPTRIAGSRISSRADKTSF